MNFDKLPDSNYKVPRLGFKFNKPIVIHLPNVSVTHSNSYTRYRAQIGKEKKLDASAVTSSSAESCQKLTTPKPAEPAQNPDSSTKQEAETTTSGQPDTTRQPSPPLKQQSTSLLAKREPPESPPANAPASKRLASQQPEGQTSSCVNDATLDANKKPPAEAQQPTSSRPCRLRTKRTPLRVGWPKIPPVSAAPIESKTTATSTPVKEAPCKSSPQAKQESPPPQPSTTTTDARTSPSHSPVSPLEEPHKTAAPLASSSLSSCSSTDEGEEEEAESTPRRSARVAAKTTEHTSSVKKVLARKSMPMVKKPKQSRTSSFSHQTSHIVTMANKHKSFMKKVVDELKNWGEFARKRLS